MSPLTPPASYQEPEVNVLLELGANCCYLLSRTADTKKRTSRSGSDFVGINSIGRPAYRRQARWTQNPQRIMASFHVYAIRSLKRNYIYVGLTNNPQRRIEEHNKGKERTTRPYRPFRTLLVECFDSRPGARKREKFLKTGTGKEYLRSIP
jgi:putative endonuclease